MVKTQFLNTTLAQLYTLISNKFPYFKSSPNSNSHTKPHTLKHPTKLNKNYSLSQNSYLKMLLSLSQLQNLKIHTLNPKYSKKVTPKKHTQNYQ